VPDGIYPWRFIKLAKLYRKAKQQSRNNIEPDSFGNK